MDLAHKLAGELRDTEAALSKTSELMGAVVQYAKTRPVFDGYKAARYSRKYLAQHEAELADYRAAKTAMSELLGGAKLPKMDTLKKQHRELSEKKKALYAEYRKAQADMRQPWQSRQISITCSATRTSKKIRPRSVSFGPPTTGACAGTSGQSVQKFGGFGELPTSIFTGLRPVIRSVATPELLAKTRTPATWHEKTEARASLTHPRFTGFLQSLCCVFHYG